MRAAPLRAAPGASSLQLALPWPRARMTAARGTAGDGDADANFRLPKKGLGELVVTKAQARLIMRAPQPAPFARAPAPR